MKEFLKLEHRWVPSNNTSTYYIRPFAFATGAQLGVEEPSDVQISIVGCPVSGYFKKGKIKLLVDETYWRGTPHTGSGYKLASNYGPSVWVSSKAEK